MHSHTANRGAASGQDEEPDQEQILSAFLDSVRELSGREVEKATGIPKPTIVHIRARAQEGGPQRLQGATEKRMVDYLRANGWWPAELRKGGEVPQTVEEARGSRAELCIGHFTSRGVVRAMGWSARDVVTAVWAYAAEHLFTQEEMSVLIEWRDAYLDAAEGEGAR